MENGQRTRTLKSKRKKCKWPLPMNRQVAHSRWEECKSKRDAISCLSSGQSPPTPDKVQCWQSCGGAWVSPIVVCIIEDLYGRATVMSTMSPMCLPSGLLLKMHLIVSTCPGVKPHICKVHCTDNWSFLSTGDRGTGKTLRRWERKRSSRVFC